MSLPLQSTVPPVDSSVLPPTLASALHSASYNLSHPQPATAPAPNAGPPHSGHRRGHSHSSSFSGSTFNVSASSSSTTRVLKLEGFSPELKTRDIQLAFSEWEDDRGGFKIKWSDESSCWIVFNDPSTGETPPSAPGGGICLLLSRDTRGIDAGLDTIYSQTSLLVRVDKPASSTRSDRLAPTETGRLRRTGRARDLAGRVKQAEVEIEREHRRAFQEGQCVRQRGRWRIGRRQLWLVPATAFRGRSRPRRRRWRTRPQFVVWSRRWIIEKERTCRQLWSEPVERRHGRRAARQWPARFDGSATGPEHPGAMERQPQSSVES